MTTFCRYHCRRCDSHFTSLEAFDAHSGRAGAAWQRGRKEEYEPCTWPDLDPKYELIEHTGVCRISDPSKAERKNVTVYSLTRPGQVPFDEGHPLRQSAQGS